MIKPPKAQRLLWIAFGEFHFLRSQYIAVFEPQIVFFVKESFALYPRHIEDVEVTDD